MKIFLKNKIISVLLVSVFFVFISFNNLSAAPGGGGAVEAGTEQFNSAGEYIGETAGSSVTTNAPGTENKVDKGTWENTKAWLKKEVWDELMKELENSAAIAYKAGIKLFLSQLAYDTATYLAEGDNGKRPMFYSDGWGEYLKNVGDNAAGTALEALGKEGIAGIKFNLCKPSLGVDIKIGLGLSKMFNSKNLEKPECTFSKMKENWSTELGKKDFLNNFQAMFNPWENDLGIALTMQTGIIDDAAVNEAIAEKTRASSDGFKDVTDPISGKIKTSYSAVKEFAVKPIRDAGGEYMQYTGNALADAVDIFSSTLISKLMQKWLQKGIVSDYPDNSYKGDWGGFANSEASGSKGVSADDRFGGLIEPNFSVRGDYDILAELTMCPDPTKAGPTNCVIADNFKQAVANRMTVGEAMKAGYLNANAIFGFNSNGLEPAFTEGYPYRSAIILRKFRILPVGWEVAAQYLRDHGTVGTKNLGDLVACYDDDDDYEGYYAAWCKGLVDPTWVLKAPMNYCKREGAGPEIISRSIVGEGSNSKLAISRNENYCGDEQACIKEKDGACELYGYCTEERRAWDFGSESCEPKYNTCQSFRNADNGSTFSYLENTLNYCSASDAGCKGYCENNVDGDWTCDTGNANKIYLNNQIEECDAENEGCHEYIRTKPGLGVNLLANASFENADGGNIYSNLDRKWNDFGTTVDTAFVGTKGLQLNTDINVSLTIDAPGFSVAGETFALSFRSINCNNGNFKLGDSTVQIGSSNVNWQENKVVYNYPSGVTTNKINININRGQNGCVIDGVKLERVKINNQTASGYTDYRASGLIYEKAASCTASDVGCELYTSVTNGTKVPATVSAWDYCDAECVGYDTFVQGKTMFDSSRPAYFIPKTAKVCEQEAVGCDEFTNLDKVGQGAEAVENYSELKQCTKPNDSCKEFYTWEGSDEAGYQLRVFSLQDSNADSNPDVATADSALCSEAIYKKSPSDPGYNPDCREYYNKQGAIFYHLNSRVINCSDDCHPYRRTEVNAVDGVGDNATCQGLTQNAGKDVHFENNTCYLCQNGGEWNDQHKACVYMAIPGEGKSCSAAQIGCREYVGNIGNNVKDVMQSSFETGNDWTGVNSNVELSSDSLLFNQANSKSLKVTSGDYLIKKTLGATINKNSIYTISFLAKGSGSLNAYFSNDTVNANFSSVNLGNEWVMYKINTGQGVNHDITASEALYFKGNGTFYIDNIKLTEVKDRYYLIKNSWQTPAVCDQDINRNAYPLFDLGCDQYTDRDNSTHYLHNFSHLCNESSLGCELMIDTQNSTDFRAGSFQDGAVAVAADKFVYAVYDPTKQCQVEDKGCTKLGSPVRYDGQVVFEDVFKKNDPDKYPGVLCSEAGEGCVAWATNDSSVYFKDPESVTCEWRQKSGVGEDGWGWLKTKVKKCDTSNNGTIETLTETKFCTNNDQCSAGVSCVTDSNDYDCPVSDTKTFGKGGPGNSIYQPIGGWAGICPAAQSGCSEYIDPMSSFSANLLFNGDFSNDLDEINGADGWPVAGQAIILEPKTLYVASVKGSNTLTIGATTPNLLWILNNENQLVQASSISVSSNLSQTFYVNNYLSVNATVSVSNNNVKGSGQNSTVAVKKSIINYQIKTGIDKQSCNGIVDFEKGCVLLNERSMNGNSYNKSTFDADGSVSEIVPANDSTADSNVLAKVLPDRVCDQWLACRSFVKDDGGNNVCFDVGLCDGVDDNSNCNNFLISKKENQEFSNVEDLKDLTGYSKVGFVGTNNAALGALKYYGTGPVSTPANPVSWYYGSLKQYGEKVYIDNGSFESAGSNGYPVGWFYDAENTGDGWNDSIFKVIDNPIEAQTEGVCFKRDQSQNCILYNPEGQNFLKLGSIFNATSEPIDMVPGQKYAISVYLNAKNLTAGSARVAVIDNNNVDLITGNSISLAAGSDWTFKLVKFTMSAANQVKIRLYADPPVGGKQVGNFYYDDIRLTPILDVLDWSTPQTCRLYPESSSQSCNYLNDTGERRKGWYGYCMEYDRYPGSADACLLWYPIDKVKGDGIEEGAGYLGKTPVYYCAEATGLIPVEYRQPIYLGIRLAGPTECYNFYPNSPDNGYSIYRYCNMASYDKCGYAPIGTCLFDCEYVYDYGGCRVENGNIAGKKGWFASNGSLYSDEVDKGIKYYDPITNQVYDDTFAYCSKIISTVSSVGGNKYWAGRVYKGSEYQTNSGSYKYNSQYEPFGSIATPAPTNNPYEWDGSSVAGNQPLYVKAGEESNSLVKSFYSATGFVAGSFIGKCTDSGRICYHVGEVDDPNLNKANCTEGEGNCVEVSLAGPFDSLKRIFAQSYGAWEWNYESKHYVASNDSALKWLPPTTLCAGGVRPAYNVSGADYCAIPPKVESITSDRDWISKNGFINLTFNTNVDDQQEPLVMYTVNWGDGESTVVSGVEMRDRIGANKFSLYHLYSYWDMVAKKSSGTPDINCSGTICTATPSIKIKDNWGWCNNSTSVNICNGANTSGSVITISE